MPSYSKFLYQAGQGKNAWWRYGLVFLLAWLFPLILIFMWRIWAVNSLPPGSTLWVILPFAKYIIPSICLLLIFKPFHHRPVTRLINSNSFVNWRKLGFGIFISCGLLFILSGILIWGVNQHPFKWIWEIPKYNLGIKLRAFNNLFLIITFSLFIKSYLLQGLTNWFRKPLIPIIILTCVLYGMEYYDFFRESFLMEPTSSFSSYWDFYMPSLINPSLFFNYLFLIVLIVLGEGIELSVGFLLGKAIYSLLVHEEGMDSFFSPDGAIIDASFVYFFTTGWGSIIYLIIFLFLISRKYKLLPLQVLLNPIPKYISNQDHLIDKIGAEKI